MSLPEASIRNPVFAVMLSVALVVFGFLGYRELGISQLPEVDFPVVNVQTVREASSPEQMDNDVTEKIEDAIFNVQDIDYVSSQSLQGMSVVTVTFRLGRPVDAALQDVQAAVSAIRDLPTDIDPPTVSKVNFNRFPVIWLTVFGDKPINEINRIVMDNLKQRIESIPGCGGIFFGGLRRRNMRVWIDAPKLNSMGLDALDVATALRRESIERPAGTIESTHWEQQIRILGEGKTVEDFRNIPLGTSATGQVIRMSDVAIVEDGLEDRRSVARFNHKPCVGIGVLRATGANVVGVCDEVKRRIPELQKLLPPELQLAISTDFSLFIKADIAEVQFTLWIGVLLTAIVTYCFLGSIGTTLNVCLSIPVSLVGTFMVVRYLGYTINFMTLLALTLSVGVVVDDAILVLENIYRHMEERKHRRKNGHAEPEGDEASIRKKEALIGANEISFAAIAATFSIVAIFFPIAFLEGAVGQFFTQFAITVTVAVLLSLVCSLTLTPMLCSLFLTVREPNRPMPRWLGGPLGPIVSLFKTIYWFIDRWILELLILKPVNFVLWIIQAIYMFVLRWCLRHPIVTSFFALLLGLLAFVFIYGVSLPLPTWVATKIGMDKIEIKALGMELVPSEDQSRFLVNMICPVGSSIDYVDEMLKRGEEIITNLKDPEHGAPLVATCFSTVAIRPGQLVSEGTIFVRLIDTKDRPPSAEEPEGAKGRTLTQTEVLGEVRKQMSRLVGVKAIVLDLSTQGLAASRGFPVNFALQGPDWEKVIAWSERVKERMIDIPALTDVNSDYRPGMPEIQIVPDDQKVNDLGVNKTRLGQTINVAIGGLRVGRFTDGEHRYDVRLRLLQDQRASPDQLPSVMVKAGNGQLVQLRDLAAQKIVSTLPVINRYNRKRKVELTANVAPGFTQGEGFSQAIALAEQIREEMDLPTSYTTRSLGNAQVMKQTISSLWVALLLGFVVAYMILGIQFVSFVHPFTVLLAVPFGVTGAVFALWWYGDTLNLMSMIGLVLLAGLVKKNSIVLVDCANLVREQERLTAAQAMIRAGALRLRPIIMTTLATVAGALPMAIGIGPGRETRAPLARGIIGGILLSTVVTLVFVPVAYATLDRLRTIFRRLAGVEERETID